MGYVPMEDFKTAAQKSAVPHRTYGLGLVFGVWGLGGGVLSGIWGLGFGVWGLGFGGGVLTRISDCPESLGS